MIGVPLPDRAMSDDEARGFRMACAAFSTWGYQLAASPRLAGSRAPEEVRARFASHGRFMMAAASALDRQITRTIPVEALTEITGPGACPAINPRRL